MPQSYSATDMTELRDSRPLEKRQTLLEKEGAERMGEDSAGNHLAKMSALEEERGRRVDSRTRALCWARLGSVGVEARGELKGNSAVVKG